jgi:glutathione S-transferase
VDYEWVEALGWNQRRQQRDGNRKGMVHHWKADELKRVNPSALVPTLIPVVDRATGEVDESKAVLNLW